MSRTRGFRDDPVCASSSGSSVVSCNPMVAREVCTRIGCGRLTFQLGFARLGSTRTDPVGIFPRYGTSVCRAGRVSPLKDVRAWRARGHGLPLSAESYEHV